MRLTSAAPGLVGMIVMSVVATAATADSDRAARLAAMCASCHRLDMPGDVDTAPITGLGPELFKSMMRSFRADERPNHIMHAVSTALSDDEIAILADFLATLPTKGKQP